MQGWELCEFIGTWFIKVFNQICHKGAKPRTRTNRVYGFETREVFSMIQSDMIASRTNRNVLTKSTSFAWASLQWEIAETYGLERCFIQVTRGFSWVLEQAQCFTRARRQFAWRAFPIFTSLSLFKYDLFYNTCPTHYNPFPYYILMEIANLNPKNLFIWQFCDKTSLQT